MNLEFKTDRVMIRPLRLSDGESIYRNVNDEAVSKWTLYIPYPYPHDGAVKFIKRAKYNLQRQKACTFGIVPVESNRAAGVVDLMDINRADQKAELGYWLGRNYWGRGIMTEAVGLILDFGFNHLNLHRISAEIFEPNLASQKVLEKSGFVREGLAREARFKHDHWYNMVCYGILDRDFS